MLKKVHGFKSSKFTDGYKAEIQNQSIFAALLLAKEYAPVWEEICIINEGPYTTDSFRLLGEYKVIELEEKAMQKDYLQAIQEGRAMGCKVFIITSHAHRWINEGGKEIFAQNEELFKSGFEAALVDAKLLITIRGMKGYMLIEIGNSKF